MKRTTRHKVVGAREEQRSPGALVLALGLVLYLLLAVVLTWPLARDLEAGPPRGTEQSATVPLFNLWTLAWNHDRLAHGYSDYWDAPIFWPERGAFALSEPQPLTGLLTAPLVWMTGSEVESYNLFLLLALALNGWFGLLLLRVLGLPLWIAGTGGAAIETLPFVHQELGVLQLVPLAGLLGFILALVRLSQQPAYGRGAVTGLTFAATYLLCGYYGIFAVAVVVPAALWYLWPALRDRARRGPLLKALALAATLAAALLVPVLVGQLHAARSFDLERSTASVERQSARVGHYLRTPWSQWAPLPGIERAPDPGHRAFFPGTTKVLLAVGILGFFAFRTRRRDPAARRHAAFFGTLVVLAGWLSLGPHAGALSPYTIVHAMVPGFASLRSLFRLAALVQIGIVGLAALGLHEIARSLGRATANQRPGVVVAAVLALFVVGEQWPRMGPIQLLPPAAVEPPWLQWVQTQTETDDVFAFFPFPQGRSTRHYSVTAQWMYWQTAHWRPMVNGYSGYFPASFRELKRRLRDFPSPPGLAALAERGTRYCVVLRARSPLSAMLSTRTATHELRHAYRDPPGVLDIYEIVAIGAGRPE